MLTVKESDLSVNSTPDEIKTLFKKALSLKNPYWILNPDSDRLTKFGLIFKPNQDYIQKGKTIYVGISFEPFQIRICLEEQYARTAGNTFEIPYQMILNAWEELFNSIENIFNRAVELANRIKSFPITN